MTISYNWLNKYLPQKIEPEKLSEILTSIGLEVEALELYENFKGGLKGLVVGEVISCEQHPNADKLKLTTVDVNNGTPLQIVCGAPNVATGQKVIVAPVGSVIHPFKGDTVTMKVAKIRGVESFGMICAEDEIGLSDDHKGILILPQETKNGTAVSDLFNAYSDWIYEIGLTPNRMDAMSHIGVAKDVCAWLSHHQNQIVIPNLPFNDELQSEQKQSEFEVYIENTKDCRRYSGIVIKDVKVEDSPAWLQNFLKAIGQRPINNIVDITNFVLHETGQPLHAFNADALTSKKIIVKNLPEGTVFKTLDEIERKLSSADLMICNNNEPVCIAGVFGGIGSGVTNQTKNIFLESAWFNPSSIRATSLKHGLRTEAAVRFEKGVDISETVMSLQRAAKLITEIAGGEISGSIIDVYPSVAKKKTVCLKYDYLKKLSSKEYSPAMVKNILSSLEFDIIKENENELTVAVPLSKTDISLPADIVEEIIRIDGLNNIAIPTSITITPAVQDEVLHEQLKQKIALMLAGAGFNEIITNSISNSKYYSEDDLASSVKLLNNLSAELDLLKPSMLETGLEILAYNINRKNNNLRFFELGKIYRQEENKYIEEEKICFWITGKKQAANWKHQNAAADFFTAKGIVSALLENINIKNSIFERQETKKEGTFQSISKNKNTLGKVLEVSDLLLQKFGIKQPIVYAELDVEAMLKACAKEEIFYKEVAQFPVVERDLAIVVDRNIAYGDITILLNETQVKYLQDFNLFDTYEGDKIENNKRSLAINFRFLNEEQTLTDAEVEASMKTIMYKLEKDFKAEIRQ